jgi:FDF domain
LCKEVNCTESSPTVRLPCSGTSSTNEKKSIKLMMQDCFGSEIYTEDFTEEFDFEKNLALFDKRLVFEEISASNQPDVIRLVPTLQNFFLPSPTARPMACTKKIF